MKFSGERRLPLIFLFLQSESGHFREAAGFMDTSMN